MVISFKIGSLGLSLFLGAAILVPCDTTSFMGMPTAQRGMVPIPPAATPIPPLKVDVDFIGAVIGPAKTGGMTWDGTSQATPEAVGLAADLLIMPGSGQLASYLTAAIASGTDGPDVFGYAQCFCKGADDTVRLSLASKEANQHDTYTPNFRQTPGYTGLQLEDTTRIRVTLHDEDLAYYDPIGIAELTRAELEAALQAGKVYNIPVGDQTTNQILFIKVSVRPSRDLWLGARGYTFR